MSETNLYKHLLKLRSKMELQQKNVGLQFKIGFVIFCLVLAGYLQLFMEKSQFRTLAIYHYVALFQQQIKPSETYRIRFRNGGEVYTFSKHSMLRSEEFKQQISETHRSLFWGVGLSVFVGFILSFLLGQFLIKLLSKPTTIRGQRIVSPEALKEFIEDSPEGASDITIASIPIRKDREKYHLWVSGKTGVGKSTIFKEHIDAVVRRNETLKAAGRPERQRIVIVDNSGEYIEEYYREGYDIIFNPFDERTVHWSLWNEIFASYDYEFLASSLIPDAVSKSEEHWIEASRTVIADLLKKLKSNGTYSNKELVRLILQKDELYALLENTLSSVALDSDAPEHAASVLGVLSPKIRALRYLHEPDPNKLFSFREFIRNDSDDRRLFIACRDNQSKAIGPLISLVIDLILSESISLSPDQKRRIFVYVDELAAWPKINALEKIDRGRKYGLCMQLSITSINKLIEIYGEHAAYTMFGQADSKVTYNCGDSKSAKILADFYGEEDVKEETHGQSFSERNDSSSVNEHRVTRRIILPGELTDLADFEAYIKLGAGSPICQVKTAYKARPKVAEGFIEGPIIDWTEEIEKDLQDGKGSSGGNFTDPTALL